MAVAETNGRPQIGSLLLELSFSAHLPSAKAPQDDSRNIPPRLAQRQDELTNPSSCGVRLPILLQGPHFAEPSQRPRHPETVIGVLKFRRDARARRAPGHLDVVPPSSAT